MQRLARYVDAFAGLRLLRNPGAAVRHVAGPRATGRCVTSCETARALLDASPAAAARCSASRRSSAGGVSIDDPSLRVILDVGANIGLFSAYAASRCPDARVHAYEPEPANLAQLRATLSANGLNEHVQVHAQAVAGAACSSVELHLNARNGRAHSIFAARLAQSHERQRLRATASRRFACPRAPEQVFATAASSGAT
jgi:FkbM family methyltransferase